MRAWEHQIAIENISIIEAVGIVEVRIWVIDVRLRSIEFRFDRNLVI